MTAMELFERKHVRYLFTQNGWDWYASGKNFYRVKGDIVLPAGRKEN